MNCLQTLVSGSSLESFFFKVVLWNLEQAGRRSTDRFPTLLQVLRQCLNSMPPKLPSILPSQAPACLYCFIHRSHYHEDCGHRTILKRWNQVGKFEKKIFLEYRELSDSTQSQTKKQSRFLKQNSNLHSWSHNQSSENAWRGLKEGSVIKSSRARMEGHERFHRGSKETILEGCHLSSSHLLRHWMPILTNTSSFLSPHYTHSHTQYNFKRKNRARELWCSL